ncbi:MAG: CDGSH iron-sulfur domain-containing protein [Candidatus Micrarchaeia archaeon]
MIKHERKIPFAVKLGSLPGFDSVAGDKEKAKNYEIHICACGLSKHKPFCDGSHMHTKDEQEGRIFCYNKDNKRIDISDEKVAEASEKMPVEYE